jgi:hypothetical protein
MKQLKDSIAAARLVSFVLLTATVLTGCGGSTNAQVARICIEGIAAEIGDHPFESDAGLFASLVREEGEGIVVIESTIIVDKGLTSEKTRGFMCRAQTDPQGKSAPTLILLQLGF